MTALKSVEVTQSSGSFKGGVHLPLVSTCFLYALVFPYIFLLFDCFEWALIDCIEKRRGHSELWQFQMGGPSAFGAYMFSLCTGISLYLPITWLFRMGTHWLHWKVRRSINRSINRNQRPTIGLYIYMNLFA